MVEDIPFNGLPVNWNEFDIGTFSRSKTLWDYQRKAVENAIKALWKFYEDFEDYRTNENAEENGNGRKVIVHDGLKVRVSTLFHTDNVSQVAEGYRQYWVDSIGKTLMNVLAS